MKSAQLCVPGIDCLHVYSNHGNITSKIIVLCISLQVGACCFKSIHMCIICIQVNFLMYMQVAVGIVVGHFSCSCTSNRFVLLGHTRKFDKLKYMYLHICIGRLQLDTLFHMLRAQCWKFAFQCMYMYLQFITKVDVYCICHIVKKNISVEIKE